MQPIKWDRDTCVVCNMVISDRRFAGEMRGGPKNTVFKFDDLGCIAFWLNDKAADYPWMREPATRLWVADVNSRGKDMQLARRAQGALRRQDIADGLQLRRRRPCRRPDRSISPTMSEHVVAKCKKGRS